MALIPIGNGPEADGAAMVLLAGRLSRSFDLLLLVALTDGTSAKEGEARLRALARTKLGALGAEEGGAKTLYRELSARELAGESLAEVAKAVVAQTQGAERPLILVAAPLTSRRFAGCEEALLDMESDALRRCSGLGAMPLVAELAAALMATPTPLLAGAGEGSAALFIDRFVLSDLEMEALLSIARDTLTTKLRHYLDESVPETVLLKLPRLRASRGVQVAVSVDGDVVARAGHFQPGTALIEGLVVAALAAPASDVGSMPLRDFHLEEATVTVTVARPPAALPNMEPAERAIALGRARSGVIMAYGGEATAVMPTIWRLVEGPGEVLGQLCSQLSKRRDCWRAPTAQFQLFEVQERSEVRPLFPWREELCRDKKDSLL